ncbi:Glu/Leu/Phe/Val dehydrogenase dimerization domain-containing protein [Amycolatopsis taiwanensis]|uniref:Glu/Leu/Phe/Val dehydrogenase dimerization domain-containing protein n=1 Tax=Amycolatopsis taiwanensis TaxID=342230 RepID=UPI0004B6440E|nr:Glu/Leu/Phe/Val dehydrogenase dimerization domain-containing protein [Amycolatopsis taiwanensis]
MTLSLPHEVSAETAAADAPFFEITWHDTESSATGYLVIDRLVRGLCSGGLRMRAGCTMTEVRGLARGMTLKEALHYEPGGHYVPLGGAKGGIDFDPYHPDAEGVLERYLAAMAPLIEQRWTMGEDFGVQQDTVDRLIDRIGLTSSVQAAHRVVADLDAAKVRMESAFSTQVDGVALDELVGGFGVAEAALAALRHRQLDPAETTAFVQGFGSMGGAAARYLARAGVRVVGIADVQGVVTNPDGLDVERLLLTRGRGGAVNRAELRDSDRVESGERWLDVPADLLVPAAMSYCIHSGNQDRVQARVIAEAANMPITPEAEERLTERGITIMPDFLANSGTNVWWWWVLFGDIDGSAGQSFAKIADRIGTLSRQTLTRAEREGVSPRSAAFAMATERLTDLTTHFGHLGDQH